MRLKVKDYLEIEKPIMVTVFTEEGESENEWIEWFLKFLFWNILSQYFLINIYNKFKFKSHIKIK